MSKSRILGDGLVVVRGSYRAGSPGSRNPFTGGYPPEPAEIEDFEVRMEVNGKQYDLYSYSTVDDLLSEIEGDIIEYVESEEEEV